MATTAKPKPAAAKRTATKARAKSSASASSARERGEQLVNDARKRGEQMLKEARKRGGKMLKNAEDSMDSARAQTQARAAKLATSVVEFQKTTFDNGVDALGRLQKRSDQMIKRMVKEAGWMPGEGKEVVEEWVSTMEKARADFKKATDKSFDLLLKYLKRLEKSSGAAKPKKASTAKKAVTKKPAKRKAKAKTKTKANAASSEGAAAN